MQVVRHVLSVGASVLIYIADAAAARMHGCGDEWGGGWLLLVGEAHEL